MKQTLQSLVRGAVLGTTLAFSQVSCGQEPQDNMYTTTMQSQIDALEGNFTSYREITPQIKSLIRYDTIKSANIDQRTGQIINYIQKKVPVYDLGTGAVIGYNGKHPMVLTNHHVIEETKENQGEIYIILGEQKYTGTVIASKRDKTSDFALIQINETPLLPFASVCTCDPIQGQRITRSGYKEGKEYRDIYTTLDTGELIGRVTSKAQGTGGESGAPAFNQGKKIVAIMDGTGIGTPFGATYYPAESIREFLVENDHGHLIR